MDHIVRAPVTLEERYASGSDAAARAAPAQKRILYIDDDEPLLWLITHMLERRGYRVSGYLRASEALAFVRAHPGDFDLALTDYSMPGMNGLQVALALREIRADLPVALISAYISEEVRAEAPGAGVRKIIQKSDTLVDMCDAVARLVSDQCCA